MHAPPHQLAPLSHLPTFQALGRGSYAKTVKIKEKCEFLKNQCLAKINTWRNRLMQIDDDLRRRLDVKFENARDVLAELESKVEGLSRGVEGRGEIGGMGEIEDVIDEFKAIQNMHYECNVDNLMNALHKIGTITDETPPTLIPYDISPQTQTLYLYNTHTKSFTSSILYPSNFRLNHTAAWTLINPTTVIYVGGGSKFKEVYQLNFNEIGGTSLGFLAKMPKGKKFHSIAYMPQNDIVYVMGGMSVSNFGGSGGKFAKSCYSYNLVSGVWGILAKMQVEHGYCSSFSNEDGLFIYVSGGPEIERYDVRRNKFKILNYGKVDKMCRIIPCDGQILLLSKKQLTTYPPSQTYLIPHKNWHGSLSPISTPVKTYITSSDGSLFAINSKTGMFKVKTLKQGASPIFTMQNSTLTQFQPRTYELTSHEVEGLISNSWASWALVGDNKLVISGGLNPDSAEVSLINLKNMTLTEKTQMPCHRSCHASAYHAGDNCVYIFGGYPSQNYLTCLLLSCPNEGK